MYSPMTVVRTSSPYSCKQQAIKNPKAVNLGVSVLLVLGFDLLALHRRGTVRLDHLALAGGDDPLRSRVQRVAPVDTRLAHRFGFARHEPHADRATQGLQLVFGTDSDGSEQYVGSLLRFADSLPFDGENFGEPFGARRGVVRHRDTPLGGSRALFVAVLGTVTLARKLREPVFHCALAAGQDTHNLFLTPSLDLPGLAVLVLRLVAEGGPDDTVQTRDIVGDGADQRVIVVPLADLFVGRALGNVPVDERDGLLFVLVTGHMLAQFEEGFLLSDRGSQQL